MKIYKISILFIALIISCSERDTLPTINDYFDNAKKYKKSITLPNLDISANELIVETENVIQLTDSALNELVVLSDTEINFNSVIVALENIYYPTTLLSNKLELIVNTSPNEELRNVSEELSEKITKWGIKSGYREDIYRIIKKLESKNPILLGEDRKLFDDYLIGYKRSGFELPKEIREKVVSLSLELSQLSNKFYTNIREYSETVNFTSSELSDIPKTLLAQLPVNENGDFTVNPSIYFQTNLIMSYSSDEQLRKKMSTASNSVAKVENITLLDSILMNRYQIAQLLGYSSWAEYSIEPKMAKTVENVYSFLTDLSTKLESRFSEEIEILKQLKIVDTEDENTQINSWDVSFYENKLVDKLYNVNLESLREYFSYNTVLHGMFDIFEDLFEISITEIQPPFKWDDSVELFLVSSAENHSPLGLFYTDMFPRKGKYNHFAQFDLISGRKLPNGDYQCPVAALICNFPPPENNKPSLLYLEDVETLFHEFGHVLHFVLTNTDYPSNAGTNVPDDFVEAPSQLLENWVYDKQILDKFAKHYKDTSKTIPEDILENLAQIQNLTVGTSYRSQISYALLDIALHSKVLGDSRQNINELANKIISTHYLQMPEGSAFIASFDHLIDYDAGYYGYIWSEIISDDMVSVFQNSSLGFLDKIAGQKLRTEIYETGDSRDINISIEKFIGRKWNSNSFLRNLNTID